MGATTHLGLVPIWHTESEAPCMVQYLGRAVSFSGGGIQRPQRGVVAPVGPLLCFTPDSGTSSSKASSKGNKLNLSKYQRVIMQIKYLSERTFVVRSVESCEDGGSLCQAWHGAGGVERLGCWRGGPVVLSLPTLGLQPGTLCPSLPLLLTMVLPHGRLHVAHFTEVAPETRRAEQTCPGQSATWVSTNPGARPQSPTLSYVRATVLLWKGFCNR